MSTTTIPVFQNTIRKTNEWLNEIMTLLDWDDRQRAYKALRAVLHTLRDRLTVEEATDLAAQLPMLIKGIYFDCWNPTGKPIKLKTAEEFVNAVNKSFPDPGFPELELVEDPQEITRAVLKVLASHVSPGEIKDIVGSLPESLRELWE